MPSKKIEQNTIHRTLSLPANIRKKNNQRKENNKENNQLDEKLNETFHG